jgi:hypothetical protein
VIDGDTALVSARHDEDPNGYRAGSAYVFRRSNGSWSQEAKLAANDGDRYDNFGKSVRLDGDTALISALFDEDPNGDASGSAYVFEAAGRGFGETGTVSTNQPDPSAWQTVTLNQTYSNPVVVMQPVSANGGHPVHVRLRNVQGSSFGFQLEEWDYRDGSHTTETISYTVMEAGQHTLSDGTPVEAGTVRTDHSGTNAGFAQSFGSAPVVLSQAQTRDGPHEIVTRQQNVSTSGFDVKVQEERRDGTHATERIGYIAIEPGAGSLDGANFEVGRTGNTVTDSSHTIEFGRDMGSSPVFLAGMQTRDGPDSAGLRYQNLAGNSVDVFVEEEQSADDETRHTTEVVGYFAFADGSLIYAK